MASTRLRVLGQGICFERFLVDSFVVRLLEAASVSVIAVVDVDGK